MRMEELDKAVRKAIKATNFCTKHGLYHGQKYKSCTPQERVLIEVSAPVEADKDLDELVRDACSVVPVPKSGYRRRLLAWRDRAVVAELENILANSSGGGNWRRVITERIGQLKGDKVWAPKSNVGDTNESN